MGRQVEFMMDKNMEKRFWDFLLSIKGLKILFKSSTGIIEIKELPEYGVPFGLGLHIYMDELGELKISTNNYVDFIISPVIEFRRSVTNEKEKRVSRGRVYVQLDYWDNGILVKKNEGLKKLYEKLVRWIRKNIPKIEIEYGDYKGKEHATQIVKSLIEEEGYNKPLNKSYIKNLKDKNQ